MRLLLLLLLAAPAFAGEADKIAMEADSVNQAACLDVAEQTAVNKAGVAMAEVSVVWVKVDEIYSASPEPRPAYLLYWRGVLGQCLDRDELALADLRAFATTQASNAAYAGLVKDAERRILRLERRAAGVVERPVPPLFFASLGGGYQRIEAPASDGWDYGLVSVDASVRLVGPLALTGFLRFGISGPNVTEDGSALIEYEGGVVGSEGNPGRSLLPLFGVGPLLRFDGPVYGFVGLIGQFSPASAGVLDTPFAAGAALTGGVEIPFGQAPLGLKVWGEVGFLHASITARGMGGVFIRAGK
jgi:hypothetical protein